MTDVLLSSTCIPQRHLRRLCEYLVEHRIDKIELSGNLHHLADAQLSEILMEYKTRVQFHIHNYFPAPAVPFVLNLGHPETTSQSQAHCKKAIDLCAKLGRKNYSLHAGLAINPRPTDLGKSQTHLSPIDLDESRKLLIEACFAVAEYGETRGVELLLENNVVAYFSCPDGKNRSYHLADLDESALLSPLFGHRNIGVLLDTGHLKVSAQTLKFDPLIFIDNIRPHIKVVQISDNDGTEDQNLPVTADSWFWQHLPWGQLDYVSLEVVGQTHEILAEQLALTKSKIDEHHEANIA